MEQTTTDQHHQMTSNDDTSHYRRRQMCSILGTWLIQFPNGIRLLWANLVVYVSAYYYSQGGYDATEVMAPWVLSVNFGAWTVGIFIAGFMLKYMDRASTQLIGILLRDSGIFLSYLAVRCNSLAALNLTFGVILGLGDGMMAPIIVLVVTEWTSKNSGLIMCFTHSAVGIGFMLNNQLATWYMNPLNLKPKLEIGQSVFFTQRSVIDKAPSFFLIFGVSSLFFHLLGFFLTTHSKTKEKKASCKNVGLARLLSSWLRRMKGPAKDSSEERELNSLVQNSQPLENQVVSAGSRDSSSKEQEERRSGSAARNNNPDTANDVVEEVKESVNVSPSQLLVTPSFHALWMGGGFAEITKMCLFNYYKMFGLRYIPDDHFLTQVGTAMSVAAAVCQFTWGWSIDRLGMKATMIRCSTTYVLLTAFYFFTPSVSRWLYAAFTVAYGSNIDGFSVAKSVAMVEWYGKAHFGANFGLLNAVSCVITLLAPPIFEGFLNTLGWFPLFFFIAFLNAISTFGIIAFVPRNK